MWVDDLPPEGRTHFPRHFPHCYGSHPSSSWRRDPRVWGRRERSVVLRHRWSTIGSPVITDKKEETSEVRNLLREDICLRQYLLFKEGGETN